MKLWKEMNEDNEDKKKHSSVWMGTAYLSTSQKMLLMFMMRMMEIRNMCMVISLSQSYPLRINCVIME